MLYYPVRSGDRTRCQLSFGSTQLAAEDYDEQVDYDYIDICGHNCAINVAKVRHEKGRIHNLLMAPDFPYMLEYQEVKKLLREMQERKARYSSQPNDLFAEIFG